MVALRCCCARSSLSSATCCLQIALERLRQSCDDEFWMIFLALALSLSMFLSSFKLVLKNASKSYFEIRFVAGFRLEKSWDDLRLSWEELRRCEKSWDELRRAEERREDMRWDEMRWETLRRHEMRWDGRHRLRWQWDARNNFQLEKRWYRNEKSRDCCCEAQRACPGTTSRQL